MKIRSFAAGMIFAAIAARLDAQAVTGPLVQFQTNLGNINVMLLPGDAPKTVANFLAYVNAGSYNNSFFHRSVAGFIIQGGGYQWINGQPSAIPTNATVPNEFKVSNTTGTLAMALLSGDPNSATDEWFFNLADNSSQLDNASSGGGPFTVFGQVADSAGLAVMNAIAAVPTYAYNSTFAAIPLLNWDGVSALAESNLVLVTAIVQLQGGPAPAIASNGVIMASAFGGFPVAAPGAFIEIYGSNLAGTTREWNGSDFVNGAAPTMLDGVTVSAGGLPAYVSYVSPVQVNAELPAGVPSGGGVQVSVTYQGQTSTPASFLINALQGGLLAPASFNVKGKQYVAAFHRDNTFVTNGAVPGVSGTPAAPGETIVFYGLGFGPVTPSSTPFAGQIAQGQTSLATPVQFVFGQNPTPGPVVYAGLAPGLTGVDQFDITVPASTPSGDVALTVTQGGSPIAQTLYIPVQAP